MERVDLTALFLHFAALWFVAVGGPSAILPDIHRYVVDAHQLLSNREFADIYTRAQAAPGPNVMYTTLIGWHLAGWSGALATTVSLLVPATTLTLVVGHFIVGGVLSLEKWAAPPTWLHLSIWLPLTLVASLWLLPRVKGSLVGLQWALYMHGFGGVKDHIETHPEL